MHLSHSWCGMFTRAGILFRERRNRKNSFTPCAGVEGFCVVLIILVQICTEMVIVIVSISFPGALFPFYIGTIAASCLFPLSMQIWYAQTSKPAPLRSTHFVLGQLMISDSPFNLIRLSMPRGLICCLLTFTWVVLIDLHCRLSHVVLLRLWTDLSPHRSHGRKNHMMRQQRPSTIWFRSIKMRHIGWEPRFPAKQWKH